PCARDPPRPPEGACRARLLGRPLAERDRAAPRAPARHREDEDARGAEAPLRVPQGGLAMKRPDFNEIIGTEGSPEELAALRSMHELLLAADAPPATSERRKRAPRMKPLVPGACASGAVGFAALTASLATGLAVFWSVGQDGDAGQAFTRPMHGV